MLKTAVAGALALAVLHSASPVWAQEAGAAAAPASLVVDTNNGPVKGMVKDGMRQFRGIPFAEPPVGDLRWMPPVPPKSWEKPYDATAFGKTCAQNVPLAGFAKKSEDEDCLYLNVYSEAGSDKAKKRPVMVWIHGGGLFAGASNDYDPSALVKQGDVVYVSMNYRLNIFGFFSHPAINAEKHLKGNYGFMDQQLALKWVKDNIEQFGGDPSNVTIFGESSGGASVWAAVGSPLAKGLFDKAIVESSSPGNSAPLQVQEAVGLDFGKAVGCDAQTSKCLRSLSAEQILKVNTPLETGNPGSNAGRFGRFNVGAMVDGKLLPQGILTSIAAGEFNRVPILAGANRDETTWFVALAEISIGKALTAKEYPDVIAQNFGEIAPQVLARYPLENHPTPSNALAAAVGDRGTICGIRRASRLISPLVKDLYTFSFDDRNAPVSPPKVSFPYLAFHTAELQYLFPLFHGATGPIVQLSPRQERLSRQMVGYWTSFAATGNPNSNAAGDAPAYWPRYRVKADVYLSLRTPSPTAISSFGDLHNCDFWDRVSG